jgi:hypothetical protein
MWRQRAAKALNQITFFLNKEKMLLLKKYKIMNSNSHMMAQESSKVPKLEHFFFKQGKFFPRNRIDEKLFDFRA